MLIKLVPSVFHLHPCSFIRGEVGAPFHDYLVGGNYYEWYYSIARTCQPKSILEIGVRFGYSMCFMALALDSVYLEGWDIESYTAGSNTIAENNVRSLGYEAKILNKNSQDVKDLDRDYDLVHVDGDHSCAGTLHDMNLVWRHCKCMVVDDYYVPDVKKAVDEFLAFNKMGEVAFIDSARGTVVIRP